MPAHDHSEESFYLIDHDGFARVPRIINAQDGRRGYAIHPVGKGNDTSAALFTTDLKTMVQEVVLNGKGVRARAKGGPKDGQMNTLGLSGKSIRGYWLHPDHLDWVKGATLPEVAAPEPSASEKTSLSPFRGSEAPAAKNAAVMARWVPEAEPLQRSSKARITTGGLLRTREAVDFADHCCQGKGRLEAGTFALDDLTMAKEGGKRLRFSPLGNRPEHPRVALVGITPGGQIEKFAQYLATMDVPAAASKAAFAGAHNAIKNLLLAHGLAEHIVLSLQGDLNNSHDILTTSIVKCCLMVDENYKFKAPDIAASQAARHCATTRLVSELRSYPTLRWVVVFGDPGWDALHQLQMGGKSIMATLEEGGLKVVKLPHFAQNFQQRQLYALSDEEAKLVIHRKPDWAKFEPAAFNMRRAVLDAIAESA